MKTRYETPEQLQAAVDAYFRACEGQPLYDKHGRPVILKDGRQARRGATQPTLSGLSFFLGFRDRHAFTEQRKRGPEFDDVVTVARSRVEESFERALYYRHSYRGAAFALTFGFGWRLPAEDRKKWPVVRIIRKKPRTDSRLY